MGINKLMLVITSIVLVGTVYSNRQITTIINDDALVGEERRYEVNEAEDNALYKYQDLMELEKTYSELEETYKSYNVDDIKKKHSTLEFTVDSQLDMVSIQEEKEKILEEVKNILIANGDIFGIQRYYDKQKTNEQIKEAYSIVKDLASEFGYGKVFKVLDILQDVCKVISLAGNQLPDTLLKEIGTSIITSGEYLNAFYETDNSKITSIQFSNVVKHLKSIGENYEELYKMSNGKVNYFGNYLDVFTQVKELQSKYNYLCIQSVEGLGNE